MHVHDGTHDYEHGERDEPRPATQLLARRQCQDDSLRDEERDQHGQNDQVQIAMQEADLLDAQPAIRILVRHAINCRITCSALSVVVDQPPPIRGSLEVHNPERVGVTRCRCVAFREGAVNGRGRGSWLCGLKVTPEKVGQVAVSTFPQFI